MRIFILTKRHTSGKDLLRDRYGRIYELACGLPQKAHKVAGIAIGYRGEPEVSPLGVTDRNASVQWAGLRMDWRAPWRTFSTVSRAIEQFRPDLLWCGGDALQVIIGTRLARRYSIPVVSDLYDNYEAFWITRIPGLRLAFRGAVHASDGITCVSEPLRRYAHEVCGRTGPTAVIENGVRLEFFTKDSQKEARSKFDLPSNAVLIGTAGSLRARRGIPTLLAAFARVRQEIPSAQLLLAGPYDKGTAAPQGEGVRYFGLLPHDNIPPFLKSLDVGVVCNRNTVFGRHSYPIKLAEMVAVGIPIVAADVGATRQLAGNSRSILFQPDDPTDLARALLQQIRRPSKTTFPARTWNDLSSDLADFFYSIIHQYTCRTKND